MTILLFYPFDKRPTGWIETSSITKPKRASLPNHCNREVWHTPPSDWSGAERGGKYLQVETYINQWKGEEVDKYGIRPSHKK